MKMNKKIIKIILAIIIIAIIGSLLYFNNMFKLQNDENNSGIQENIQTENNINNSIENNITNIVNDQVTSDNNNTDGVEKNNLVSYNGMLKIENNTLVNSKGEKIQLKGISTHGIQWYGKYANEKVIKNLRDEWGANLFRIAMYTSEGGYLQDRTIKNKVYEIADIAIKLDMYVIIDWHILDDNDPLQHINEAQEFFEETSLKYGNTPNIIYEICNEPNGDITWKNNIKPYAEKVISTIRENSKENIIIVGTGTWCQDVDKAAEDPINDKNVMYSLHFYAGTHTEWLRERASKALKTIPIFVSEWGVSDATGNGGIYLDEANKWMKFMKQNNISWANWSLSDKNEASALLLPNTPENDISDKYLSESGKFVKEAIKD